MISLARVDTRYLSLGLVQTIRPLCAVKIGCFTPDKSRNNFLHAQTMAAAILFESRITILATVQHNWQGISWLYIGSTKEFHVRGYATVSKQGGRIPVNSNMPPASSCVRIM